jgi:Cu-Zn family superoxide dismutase
MKPAMSLISVLGPTSQSCASTNTITHWVNHWVNVIRYCSRQAIAFIVAMGFAITMFGVITPSAWAQTSDSTAQATIFSTSDPSEQIGEATFAETSNGLRINVAINDAPQGYHGFHIHENGSCDDGGQAARGHFNPLGVKHGRLITDGFERAHAGDLGNIYIHDDNSGSLTEIIRGLPLTDGEKAIANKAVILHEQRDDYGQPTGNAGGRIGCGIITLNN